MINKVIIVGKVNKSPEFTKTDKGVSVLKLKVETTHKDSTEWHNVNVYDKLALEFKDTKEGDYIALTGRNSTRSYEGKDGTKKYFTNIIAETFKKIEQSGTRTTKNTNADDYDYDQIPF